MAEIPILHQAPRNPEWFIAAQGGGSSVVDFSTFLGFSYVNNASLPTKPVEKGQFITANKWANPYVVDVTIGKSGNAGEIKAMLESLESLVQSVELVDVVTPVRVFINGNIESIEYSFTGDETGPSMVMPKITIKEIRFFNASETTSDISSNNAKNAETGTGEVGGLNQGAQAESYASQWGLGG